MHRATILLAVILASSGWAQSASAADPQYARSLAATCFTCHGTDGRSVNSVPPSLAGQNKDYLLKQLQEFLFLYYDDATLAVSSLIYRSAANPAMVLVMYRTFGSF